MSASAAWLIITVATLAGLGLYFLPAMIAFHRGHHQRVAILLVTIFLGWTFLGWVGALVWSGTHIPAELRRA